MASKFFAQISTTAMQNIFDRPMQKANICTPVIIRSWSSKSFHSLKFAVVMHMTMHNQQNSLKMMRLRLSEYRTSRFTYFKTVNAWKSGEFWNSFHNKASKSINHMHYADFIWYSMTLSILTSFTKRCHRFYIHSLLFSRFAICFRRHLTDYYWI